MIYFIKIGAIWSTIKIIYRKYIEKFISNLLMVRIKFHCRTKKKFKLLLSLPYVMFAKFVFQIWTIHIKKILRLLLLLVLSDWPAWAYHYVWWHWFDQQYSSWVSLMNRTIADTLDCYFQKNFFSNKVKGGWEVFIFNLKYCLGQISNVKILSNVYSSG